jgi:hypothetical protein
MNSWLSRARRTAVMWGSWALLAVMALAYLGGSAFGEPRVTVCEAVSENCVVDDGGNAWGGHQCRIVRTQDGIFTVYTVAGYGYLGKQWRLAQRSANGWKVLAKGVAGREPAGLLAAPDGTLHVVGWPEGQCTIWSGKPMKGTIDMQPRSVPGAGNGHWPYGSAGMDSHGNLCILSSEGLKPGSFRWAFYHSGRGEWTTGMTPIDYRYCYTYVIPHSLGGLALVSTRGLLWGTLGYQQPQGSMKYVCNAFRYWETSDITKVPLQVMATVEEKPTDECQYVFCNAQNDAYRDREGRMHILFRISGPSTGRKLQVHHVIFANDGKKLHEKELPREVGSLCRIFQDDRGFFWILGLSGQIYPLGLDGVTLGRPTKLDLQGHEVDPSGFSVSVPRTGTPAAPFIDTVFPSAKGTQWIYCRILLRDGED